MTRFGNQQVEPFFPNHLPRTGRLIVAVEEADVASLLQQKNSGEDEWYRTTRKDEKGAPRSAEQYHRHCRHGKADPGSACDRHCECEKQARDCKQQQQTRGTSL